MKRDKRCATCKHSRWSEGVRCWGVCTCPLPAKLPTWVQASGAVVYPNYGVHCPCWQAKGERK